MNEANRLLRRQLDRLANAALDDVDGEFIDPVVLVQRKHGALRCVVRERIVASQIWPSDEQGDNEVRNADPSKGRVVAIMYLDSDNNDRAVIYHVRKGNA